jgi:hypothetical protein
MEHFHGFLKEKEELLSIDTLQAIVAMLEATATQLGLRSLLKA